MEFKQNYIKLNVTPLRRNGHEAFFPLSRAPRPEGKCQGPV